MCNKYNNVLYVGVTSNLKRRVKEHKDKIKIGFTNKYNINKLVYYEKDISIDVCIKREKQIKKWNRAKKIKIIESKNKEWTDLYKKL